MGADRLAGQLEAEGVRTAALPEPNMKIAKDSVVRFHYTVSEQGQEALESSKDREPLAILIGHGNIIPGLETAMHDHEAGDSFGVDWIPGVGTQVLVNGQPQGEPIREPEFFRALLRIWLGDKPADAQLKDQLLGKAVNNVGGSPGQQ